MNALIDQPTAAALGELIAAAKSRAPQCRYCVDTNIYQRQSGEIVACPANHAPAFLHNRNLSAQRLVKAVWFRVKNNLHIEPKRLDIAKLLTLYTTDAPIKRDLIDRFVGTDERTTKKHLELLRSEWLLPIGSRKFDPVGHWIIVDKDDYLRWESDFRRAPATQLSTCWKLRKANFPTLAGQSELDFVRELKAETER